MAEYEYTYCVNIQKYDGHHEVHRLYLCNYLPDKENILELGSFSDCKDALKEAEGRGYSPADGCYHCTDCHSK